MLFRTVTILCAFTCLVLTLRYSSAQDADPLTPTKPPQLKLGQIHVAKLRTGVDEPTVTLLGYTTVRRPRTREEERTEKIPQTRTRVVVKDGQVIEEAYVEQVPVKSRVTVTYTVEVPATKTSHFPAKQIRAWDTTGRHIETDELLERLAKPRHVFVLDQPVKEESSPIDAFHRSVLKDDVLLIYVSKRAARKPESR